MTRASGLVAQKLQLSVLLLAVAMPTAALAQERARVEIVPSIGHARPIDAAAFAPDGTRILSAGEDGILKLWEAATGRLLQTFEGAGRVAAMAFSPDGAQVLTGDHTSLRLWDAATGQHIKTLKNVPLILNSIAFSPDGKSVLVGSSNGTVQLRGLESGRTTRTFRHADTFARGITVAFSPDGARVLTAGSGDKLVKVWDTATGRPIQAFGESRDSVLDVRLAISPDGSRVVVGDNRRSGLAVWDVANGKLVQTLDAPGDWRGKQFIAFSRDGTLVLAGGIGWVRAWDAKTGQLRHAFGEDTLRKPDDGRVYAVSPDGTRAVSGGRTLTLWDVTKGQPVRDYVGLAHPVAALAVSPGGDRVLTGGFGGTIGVWDVATGMPVKQGRLQGGFRSEQEIVAVAFLRQGARALVRKGLTLELWDVGKGHELLSLRGYTDRGTPIAISPDGATIAARGYDTSLGAVDRVVTKKPVTLWDTATGEVVRSFDAGDKDIYALAFSPDGSRLVSGGARGSVKVWDMRTRSHVRDLGFGMEQKEGRWTGDDINAISAVAFSPDGSQVLSAGHEGANLKLWDVATGQPIRTWEAQPHVRSLLFSPDGRQVLSAGDDTKFRLWDVATGRLVHTFAAHSGKITALAFSNDGRRVFSGSHDGTTGVWNAESGELLAMMLMREGGEWLTVTPEGFFDASVPAVAGGVLSVVRGLDTFGIDPFIATLHRPDLVREKLGGDRDGKVRAAAAKLDLRPPPDSGGAPSLAPAPAIQAAPQAAPPVSVVPQMGHSSSIAALAYSQDGRFAASGGNDDTVKLWDVATGRELRTFSGHGESVTAVAFSPDGRSLLSGSEDATLKLWDLANGKQLRSFTGHSDTVAAVAFSPDGRFVLSADSPLVLRATGNLGTMKLWEIATGRVLRTFKGHSEGIESVAFSPDGRLALSGSRDQRIKLWDLSAGTELRSFSGHSGRVFSVAFSPDGRFAISGSADKTMRLWEVDTGKELRRFPHSSGVTSVAFAADGRLAVSGLSYDSLRTRDGRSSPSILERVRVWDVSTGVELRKFVEPGDPVTDVHVRIVDLRTRVALSPDGRFALSNFGDAMLLWDVATGKLVRGFFGYSNRVRLVAFSADGHLALSDSGRTMHLWDVATGKRLRSFGQSWHGTAAAFSPDGRLVLTGTHGDFERRMMDTPAGKGIALSPDGRLALSASGWTMKLWETATGREVRGFGGATPSSAIDNTVTLWDVETGKDLRRLVGHKGWVTSAAFSPDGQRALTGGRDHAITLWDVTTGKELRTFDLGGGDFMFQGVAVAFLGDGRYALSGSSGGLRVWEVDTGKLVGGVRDPIGRIATVTFSADGRRAVSVSKDNTVKLWDMTTGKELRSFTGHTSSVDSVAVSPDGRLVLSGSNDGTSRIWDAGTGRELARMMAGFDDWVAMTPEGFFSSSRRDTNMLSLVRGLEATTIGQVYQSLYNPDLVREALASDADGAVRRAAEVVSLEKVIGSGPPPSVAILSPAPGSASSADLVTVTARIADRGKGIGRIEWRVNGVTAGVSKAPAEPGVAHDVKQTLALDPGENRIEVIAYERRNLLASPPARTIVAFHGPAKTVKPKLHILAIGINDYVDRGAASQAGKDHFPPLKLAVADARAFAARMRRAGTGLYSEVHVTEALDADATAADLDRIVARMSARINPRDTFVLFAAAHGTSRDGRFYLIPQDYQGGSDPKALAERAIDQERLRDWVANRVKARRAIILLDTCESGALVSGYTKSRTDVPASEAAIGRLHEATGRPVLTAAASGKPAFEGYQGHGVFTFAAMEALHLGDTSGNGTIEVSELVAHVQDRVPKLSAELEGRGISMVVVRGARDDKQSAHFGSTGEDFPLVKRLP